MSIDGEHALLSSGRPLEDPANDKLGYAGFARTLADAIEKMMPPEGLGGGGLWGVGFRQNIYADEWSDH